MDDRRSVVQAANVVYLALPGGGMALLHQDRRRLSAYNRPARLLWRSLGAGGSACLPHILVARYGLPLEAAQRDVDAILSQWIEQGLVVAGGGDPSPAFDASPAEIPHISPREKTQLYRFANLVVALSADASVLGRIAPLLSHLRVAGVKPDLSCVIGRTSADRLFIAVDGRMAVDDVEEHVVVGAFYQTVIEKLHPGAQWRAFMHAAAVARDNAAAIFAAPSGSGKSTLTASLVVRGYEYFSDDIVPLMSQGDAVAPFPLPSSVKPGSAPVLSRYYPNLDGGEASELQYLVHETSFSARLALARALIFPRYVSGAPTRFEQLSVTDALTRLLSDRVYLGYPIEPAAVRGFVDWLGRVRRYELIYSEITEADRCVSQALAS